MKLLKSINIPKSFLEEKKTHIFFEISVILKGVDAVLEIIGAFLVLFITQNFVQSLVTVITQEEIREDSTDLIANYLIKTAAHFSVNGQMFIFFYLLSHGIIKIFLVGGLLKRKHWAYPVSIIIFSIFVLYQIYRYTYTQSLWLIFLTIFDLFLIWLVWKEYRYLQKKNLFKSL